MCVVIIRHPLHVQYDLDKDGDLDVLLTTTDAEIVFLKTDNTLFHGETIKVKKQRHPFFNS